LKSQKLRLSSLILAFLALTLGSASTFAQIGAVTGPPLATVPPDREFASSSEHYQYLLQQAGGGTRHTMETVPRWDGLWYTSGNNHLDLFIDGGLAKGTVREGAVDLLDRRL
jgi:hypothetical protein